MKDGLRLVLLGFVPLLVGYLLNYVFLLLPGSPFFFAIVLLLLWAVLCRKKAMLGLHPLLQALLMNGVSLVMLLLTVIQEYIVGGYWANIFGLLSQVCFLPCLSLVAVFMGWFTSTLRLVPIYAAEWLLMFAASAIGITVNNRRT